MSNLHTIDTQGREHLLKGLRRLSAISSETSSEKYETDLISFFLYSRVEMELNDLVTVAKEAKGPGAWTSGNLIRVGGILAAKINSIENLSGGEKLKLVQRVLLQGLAEVENKEIAEPGITKEEIQKIHDRYDVLEATVADVLPASLELAIKAARGSLDLKKIKPSTWVKMCSCFATSVVHQLASMNLISEAHATQARRLLATATEKAEAVAVAKEAEEKKEEPPKESSAPETAEAEKSSETSPATEASSGTSQ